MQQSHDFLTLHWTIWLKQETEDFIIWFDIPHTLVQDLPDSRLCWPRYVCAHLGVAVHAARPPASGDSVPGFDSAEPHSQTQVVLQHHKYTKNNVV